MKMTNVEMVRALRAWADRLDEDEGRPASVASDLMREAADLLLASVDFAELRRDLEGRAAMNDRSADLHHASDPILASRGHGRADGYQMAVWVAEKLLPVLADDQKALFGQPPIGAAPRRP